MKVGIYTSCIYICIFCT